MENDNDRFACFVRQEKIHLNFEALLIQIKNNSYNLT